MSFFTQRKCGGVGGYITTPKFRPPQSVSSGMSEHAVLKSSVFPPASSGRHKNQLARYMPVPTSRNRSKFWKDAPLLGSSVHGRMAGGSKFSAGYTAIEIVIVASIMMIISAIVLVGFGGLNDSVAVNRSVRDLAVALRRAQNMALAVTGIPVIGNVVPPAIGIQLTKGASTYLLFADRAGASRDFKYGASDGELIQSFRFERNVTAYQFFDVNGDSINPAEGVLHIIFSAPEADLQITDGNGDTYPEWAKVGIVFRSPGGKEKIITVRESGQINVE